MNSQQIEREARRESFRIIAETCPRVEASFDKACDQILDMFGDELSDRARQRIGTIFSDLLNENVAIRVELRDALTRSVAQALTLESELDEAQTTIRDLREEALQAV